MKIWDGIRQGSKAIKRGVELLIRYCKGKIVSLWRWFDSKQFGDKVGILSLIVAILGLSLAFWIFIVDTSTPAVVTTTNDSTAAAATVRKPLFSANDTTFKVLILPFDREEDCSAKQADVAKSLFDELKRMNEREGLGLDIQYLDDKSCPATFNEGRSIGANQDADLVIWGDQWVMCHNDTTRTCVAYALVDTVNNSYSEAQSEGGVQVLSSLAEIREGRLTKDIDYIIRLTLGLRAYEQSDYTTALGRFLNIEPDRRNRNALVAIGMCYYHLGEFDSALVNLNRAIATGSGCASCVYYNTAVILHHKFQRYDSAIALYRRTIRVDPGYARAYTNLADLLLQQYQSHDSAVALYRKAIEVGADFSGAYTNLASLLRLHYQSYDSARTLYRKAIDIDPNCASAYNNLANLLEVNYQSYDSARALYLKAIEIDSNHAIAYNNLAKLLENNYQSYDSARALYQKAVDIDSSLVSAYSNLASILGNHYQSHDRARALFLKAIEIDSNHADAYFGLAILLFNQSYKNQDSAKVLYQKAIELNPNHFQAVFFLAILHHTNFKNFERAKVLYRKAIDIEPASGSAYFFLAELFRNHYKNYDSARMLYWDAIAREPERTEAYINMASLLIREFHESDSARSYYEAACRLEPRFKTPENDEYFHNYD